MSNWADAADEKRGGQSGGHDRTYIATPKRGKERSCTRHEQRETKRTRDGRERHKVSRVLYKGWSFQVVGLVTR